MRLLVAGQDRVGRFGILTSRQKVHDKVTFLGGRDDIPDLLLAADTLVHPARSEAAGIVLLEAMVAGLPVIATAACGYAHHIEAAGAGIILPEPFNQASLNDALLQTMNAEFLAQCRARGLAYAGREDLYSQHITGADIIEQVLSETVSVSDV